jgi:hypothetical protein
MEIDEETTELIFRAWKGFANSTLDVVPGWHLGILEVWGPDTFDNLPPEYDTMYKDPLSVHPVMIYAE